MALLSSLDFSVLPTPVFKNPKFRRLELLDDFLDLESLSFRDFSVGSSREEKPPFDREEEATFGEFKGMPLLLPEEEDLNPNRGIVN
jgi:hypothetical protein